MKLHDLSRRFFRARGVWIYKGGDKTATQKKRAKRPGMKLLAVATMTLGLTLGAATFGQQASAEPVNDNRTAVSEHVSAFNQAAEAQKTRYSKHVERINKTFGHMPGHLPIVMLDRDAINNELARRGKMPDDREALKQVIRETVSELSGKDFPETLADDVAIMYPTKSGFAFQFTHGESPNKVAEGQDVCVVMARDPDRSLESTLMHKLQFSPEVYGEEIFKAGLLPIMTRDEILVITDMHELSHCMDTRHITTVQKYLNNPGERDLALEMHKAEAFAEINAIILMVRDGYDMSIADRRADLRATYSYMGGRFLGRLPGMPQQGPIGPGDYGAIYGFSKALRETGKIMRDMGVEKLKAMSVDEVIAMAQDIVEKHALSAEEFSAITGFHNSKLHRELVEKFARDPNERDWWRERKALIDEYERYSLEAMERVINVRDLDKPLIDAIPNYETSTVPPQGTPKPWDAPFKDEAHVIHEIQAAYYDLKIGMAQNGHDTGGLFKSVADMRDKLRAVTGITSGEVDRSVRRRLAAIHAAAATISHELQTGAYQPLPERDTDPLLKKQAKADKPAWLKQKGPVTAFKPRP